MGFWLYRVVASFYDNEEWSVCAMAYTQENKFIAIDTPLGEDALLLQGFTGHEGVLRLFGFDLELLSEGNLLLSWESSL